MPHQFADEAIIVVNLDLATLRDNDRVIWPIA